MISLKRTLITGLILGVLTACGSSEGSAERFFASGKALIAEGSIDKARIEFRNAIQVEPEMADAYYQLALIDEKLQNWKGMFANLSRVEQLSPTYYEAIIKLGQVHLLAGNFDIALEKANKVIAADNQNVMAYALRASLSMKQMNFGSALSDIEQALAIDPDNIEVISVKVLVLHQQGKSDDALDILETALKANPNKLPLTMIKLSILEGEKDYAAMEQVYNGLLTAQPDANWVVISLAKLFNLQERYADAKEVLTHFIASHPEDAQAKLLLVLLVKTKEPQEAINLLGSYIAEDKNNYALRLSKVQLLLASGQVELAITDLEEIAKLDQDGNSGRKAQVILAGINFQKGDVKAAGEIIKKVLVSAPEDELALLLKSRFDIMNKDIDTAVTNLRTVLRNNPESDKALVLLAQAYMNSGSVELADDNFRKALTVNPTNTIAALSVANSLMKNNDLNRTEDVLVKSLLKDPNNEPLLQALAQVRILKKDWLGTEAVIDNLRVNNKESAFAHYLTARISQGQELYQDALVEYKAALALKPNMVRALQGLSTSYIQLKQQQSLVDYLAEFIAKNPKQLAGYAILAEMHVKDKQWDNALATLEEGLNIEPRWLGGYGAIAAVYYAQNMPIKAIDSYQRGLKQNPDNNFISLQLASAYERSGEFEKAKLLYEAVLAKDNSIEPAINNLASLYTDQFNSPENLAKALSLSERFKGGTEPYYLDTYAWVNVQLGHFDKAQNILERVVSLSPDVAVFNYHLGYLLMMQGNKEEAKTYLTRAKDLAEQQGDMMIKSKVTDALKQL